MADGKEFNGWVEYKQRVLFQLEDLTERIKILDGKVDITKKDLDTKLDELKTDLVILKTKIVIYVVIAGFIISIITQVLMTLFVK
jgi:CBS-domain-containing membrane protein